jgi:hypothetical protein
MMKKEIKFNGQLLYAYCEYAIGFNKKTNQQTIKIIKQVGEHDIFNEILKQNDKIGCRDIDLFGEDDEQSDLSNKPLIEINSLKNGERNREVGRIIYKNPTTDCFLFKRPKIHRLTVLVYRNLKHKEHGLHAMLYHNLLEADIHAFKYHNG